ncbi:MAG: hypothetical protein ACK6D7_10315, partial [Acidobacteriota bacterium]
GGFGGFGGGGGGCKPGGGGGGASLELEIRAIFRNRVEVMPHGYDPRGRVLVVGGRAPYALAFETDGDVVTALRAGVRETLLG